MGTDLFISYAWTSPEHREWVRLFASQLHLLGYALKIDEAVDYGSSLSGFMREVTEATHVLLIVDENYVDRADNQPNSGVGIETAWIRSVYDDKPSTWLSVVLVRNPNRKRPTWLAGHNPKSFNFNANTDKNEFPGAEQINEIWRWVEGLPASKANAVPLSEVRKRAARIERIDAKRDPANYVNPRLKGNIKFNYRDYRDYTIGHGEYEFKVNFSGRGSNSIYVYLDSGLKAIGLITVDKYDPLTLDSFLTPGRTVEPTVGQSVVLMNQNGALCVIDIEDVQDEINSTDYIPPQVIFSYTVLEAPLQ